MAICERCDQPVTDFRHESADDCIKALRIEIAVHKTKLDIISEAAKDRQPGQQARFRNLEERRELEEMPLDPPEKKP